MSSLFRQMKLIAESVALESKDTDRPLFKYCKDDLYDIDKDIIENDAVPGDEYIWSIRESGHGTDLYRLNGQKDLDYLVGSSGERAKYFHIVVSEIGKGSLSPITRDKAIELTQRVANPQRVPRRYNFYKAMEHLIGLKAGVAFSNTFSMANSFYPGTGAVSLMKVEPIRGGLAIALDQIAPDSEGRGRGKSVSNIFDVRFLSTSSATKDAPSFYRIKTPREGYAVIEELSERKYKSALTRSKRLEERKVDNLDLR